MKNLFASMACVAACCMAPAAASAAVLSLETSASYLLVGKTVDVRLWIRGLGDAVVDNYVAGISFDARVLQLSSLSFGDGRRGDQLNCPGPTPDRCTHVGGPVQIDTFFSSDPALLVMAEGSNASHSLLVAEQLDDFIVLTLGFTALRGGLTDIAASMSFAEAPGGRSTQLDAPTRSLPVLVPEPDAAWLALTGLVAAFASRPRRRR